MKKFTQLLIVICLSATIAHAQVWTSYTPPFDDTIGIASIKVVDANVVWMVGLRYGVDDSLYYYGYGNESYYAVTADGGATWKTGKLPMGEIPFIACITATDAGAAMVIGLSNFGDAKTLKTTDGGETWTVSPNNWDPVASWPDYIHAFTPAKYCVIGDPRNGEFEIYVTLNAGLVWQSIAGSNIPDPLPGEFGYNNFGAFHGNTIWFGTNKGRIFRSDNSGLTWSAKDTPLGELLGGMAFADGNNGIISNSYGLDETIMYATDNGGETWTQLTNLPYNGKFFNFGSASAVPGQRFLVMGLSPGGNLSGPYETWISPDFGLTWQQVSTGEIIGWPSFINGTTGWAGEFQQLSHPTRVFKYTGSPLVGLSQPEKLDAAIEISPNPATDYVRIQVQAEKTDNYWVLMNDIHGKLLRKAVISDMKNFTTTLNINDLPAGEYTITIAGSAASTSRKIILAR